MDVEVYRRRRERFLENLPEGAVAVLPAAPVAVKSNDVEYPYRQDNDLLYLTGFPEAGSVCVLDRDGDERFLLFVLPRDAERETWTGKRFGIEGAREVFGADAAHEAGALDEILAKLLPNRRHLFFALGRSEAMNRNVLEHFQRAQETRRRDGSSLDLSSPADLLHDMRLRKDGDELERMRRAVAISAVAHREAREATRPGAYEYEIEATLDFAFRRLGARGPAYPSIVASGPNATILHHVENSRRFERGDLLLIDAGAEFEHYASDVTRTFPVDGQFTPEQRAVYDVVLAANEKAIEASRPGVTLDDIHQAALRVLVDGLRDLGVLDGPTDEAIEKATYRPYFMHRTGHWLGMDVHDVGPRSTALEPGMVFTIEPGLYFGAGTPESRFSGIGVRIEDDCLITESGHEILTREIPKRPDELES